MPDVTPTATVTPAPTTDTTPKYKPSQLVTVEMTDGTVVSCQYSFFKKNYENDGATVTGEYVIPTDARTAELEKMFGGDDDD